MDESTVQTRSGNYIMRHWHGELSLPRSYWLNGVLLWGLLVNMGGLVALTVLVFAVGNKSAPLTWSALGAYLAIEITVYLWALVGIWRSAGRYTGPAIWKVLARVAICLGVIVSIANMARTVTSVSQILNQGGSITVGE